VAKPDKDVATLLSQLGLQLAHRLETGAKCSGEKGLVPELLRQVLCWSVLAVHELRLGVELVVLIGGRGDENQGRLLEESEIDQIGRTRNLFRGLASTVMMSGANTGVIYRDSELHPNREAGIVPGIQMTLQHLAAGKSDRGILRAKNEDALLVDVERGVYAVADGIGGLPYGDEASERAIEVLRQVVQTASPGSFLDFRSIFDAANEAVVKVGLNQRLPYSTGTTLTALQIVGDQARFCHIGDSALHLFQNGKARKLTNDHTLAEDKLFQNPREARHYTTAQQHNVLTRCIGAADRPVADFGGLVLEPDMWLMLSTDGLFKGVLMDEILPWFTPDADPAKLVDRLIELNLSRGAPDNVTVILVKCLAR
jgi:protein phosphatase